MINNLPDYPALQAIQNSLWHLSDVRGAAVMVGSGFSVNAELASPVSKAPPLWSQISTAMQQQLGASSSEIQNPLRLAEEFRSLLGQAALDTLIRDMVPDPTWIPGRAHHRLLQLPWSDVLSTNWDTLLERATTELIDHSYDVVYTPKDIARTRSPRIIKLHGTLPSHTPFIFAEEDYRTYPSRFAPFVNLAQHILLENELLLVGFSGDDPNFLAWAGWVRDQLGTSARKIRLAGVLELSTARRRYLENLNVAPIDLTPLVKHISDSKQRHAKATELLLDSLHTAKPKPIHVWTKVKSSDDTLWKSQAPALRIEELVKGWRLDRENAPNWLIAPYYERYSIRQNTVDMAKKALPDLSIITPALRARFAAELAWRLETSHFGVPNWAKQVLSNALGDVDAILHSEERRRILTLLCYTAIEDRDTLAFEQYIEELNREKRHNPEAEPWSAYLRGLYARDWLNFADIPPLLSQIAGCDPIWLLRRASLHCSLCENQSAAKLVRDALHDIRRKRALDRKSLWLLSREAWARFMWRALSFELREHKEKTNNDLNDWPSAYKTHDIDPWDQLNALDHAIQEEHKQGRNYSRKTKAHFDAGSWTPMANCRTYFSSWVLPAEWTIRRLADSVGLPIYAGTHSFLETRLFNATQYSEVNTALIWRTASYIRSSDDDFINRNFGRIQVAAMPATVVSDLVKALRQSLDYFAKNLQNRDANYVSRVEKVRSQTEMLSRLAVRCSPDVADELIEMITTIVNRGHVEHWWLYKSIGNLITRSLSAIPPSERGKHCGQMLNFPLPEEYKANGIERDWPEFSDAFHKPDIIVERPDKLWDKRISELIDWVSKDNNDNRHRAISRLWLLHLKKVLTESEVLQFAEALWSKRESPESLPTDISFHPGVYLQLPSPKPQMATMAFNHDVLQPLLNGTIPPGALESIAYIGSEADKGRADRPFSPAIALELIRKLPFSSNTHADDPIPEAIFFGLLPITELDEETTSKLWNHATRDNTGDGLLFLPYIARYDTNYEERATARLRRAMSSREFRPVNLALSAIRRWSQIVPHDKFPTSLASATASQVAMRRDPGLFRAIDISVDLVQARLMSEDDITRLLDGLSELIIETDYQNWREGDFWTPTLTYVRANAYRLARILHRSGNTSSIVNDWITTGSADSVPEVRYAPDKHD